MHAHTPNVFLGLAGVRQPETIVKNNGGEYSSSEQLRKLQLAFENLEHSYET